MCGIVNTITLHVKAKDINNNDVSISARSLIDTGALQSNYMSIVMANKLKEKEILASPSSKLVCGVDQESCKEITEEFNVSLCFYNEVINQCESKETCFSVIDMKYDIIIGRPDIIKYNLLNKMKSHFASNACNKEDDIKKKMPGFPLHEQQSQLYYNDINDEKQATTHAEMQSINVSRKRKNKKAKKQIKSSALHCLLDSPNGCNGASSVGLDADPVNPALPALCHPILANLWEVRHKDEFVDKIIDTDGIPFIDDDMESPWQRAIEPLRG